MSSKKEKSQFWRLLVDLSHGAQLRTPVLLVTSSGSDSATHNTGSVTVQLPGPAEWIKSIGRKFRDESFIVLPPWDCEPPADWSVSIGRSRKCDVRIKNKSVSSVHARINRDVNTYFVTDAESRNRTYQNGHALEPGKRCTLHVGDKISFGDAQFVFIDPETVHKLATLPI